MTKNIQLRRQSKRNPLDLEIGDIVTVKKYVVADYDKEGKRDLHFYGTVLSKRASIIGSTYICLGQYQKGHTTYHFDGDYEPPYLQVTKRVIVYEVRTDLTSKIHKVLPEDIICD